MRRLYTFCILQLIICFFCSISSCNSSYKDTISNEKELSFHGIPRPDSFVSDHDSILTVSQYDSLNVASIELLKDYNVSLITLLVNKSGVDNFKEEFADSIFNFWGIGDSDTNRGLLFAISIADRNIAIVTGLGLETECPDSVCAEIIQDMIPYCKKGEYYNALKVGTNDIKKVFQMN